MEENSSGFFLRSTDGKSVRVPDHFKFLEIKTYDGLVAAVLTVTDNGLSLFSKSDEPWVERYKLMFPEVKFGDLDIFNVDDNKRN